MFAQGLTKEAMAEEFGKRPDTIRKYLTTTGIKKISGRTSMKSKKARLREMAAQCWPTAKMAQELGLRRNTVSGYLKELGIPYTKFSRDVRGRHRNIVPILDTLRKERMIAGLTMIEFSRRIGWDRSLISEWERGVRRIHTAALIDYANGLNFDLTLTKRAG